jgi:hypothetical protein
MRRFPPAPPPDRKERTHAPEDAEAVPRGHPDGRRADTDRRADGVLDSSKKELESDDIFTHIANDQTASLSYTYAAPPENVKAVDVQIGSWPMFRNIPVAR